MSTRIAMVRAGSVKIGDTLQGFVVTGLGRVWTLDDEDNCAVGAAPWETVRVCYAYGEKAARTPAPVEAPEPPAPAYGSMEWKRDRLARLPEMIEELEWKQRRNKATHPLQRDWAKWSTSMRAELESLRAELSA